MQVHCIPMILLLFLLRFLHGESWCHSMVTSRANFTAYSQWESIIIKEFRCNEAKIEASEKARSQTQDSQTTGSHYNLPTEPRQLDNHLDHNPKLKWPVVVQLLWFSSKVLAAQAKAVLNLTRGDCQRFHFPLFCLMTSTFLYFQCVARCLEQWESILITTIYKYCKSSRSTKYCKTW